MGFLTDNATGEHDVLATYILQQFAQIRTTVHGLTDEQARSRPAASDLNLVGLLLHCGAVGVYWTGYVLAADQPSLPEGVPGNRDLGELCADERPLTEVLATFDLCVETMRANLERIDDMSKSVPVFDAPWLPPEWENWEARWCLAHVVAEVARHTGHADIIRESIDGKGSFELNDLVDGTNYAE